ncbi:MAG TPA: hypothetical protein VFE78_31675 [Gemmataceae bacterium]|jgi:hypothetical protein|nr:hypothetical protein [Gemmataceae bacterium]
MPLRDKLGLNKSKPPLVGVERVTCACGHEAELELFDDKKDRAFRDARRRKLAGRPCADCRQKAHAEREAREKAQAARRPGRGKGGSPRPVVEPLPDGSAFAVSYDAQAGKWFGTLTVTTAEGGQVFEGEVSAVFKLLSALDAQYREWLAAQAAPPAAGA